MKVTRRQIREIIREHETEQRADYLLNEGIFDWLKKLGKAAMAAFKKQQQVADEFYKDFGNQLTAAFTGQPEEAQGPAKKIAEKYVGIAEDAKKSLLAKIITDMENDNKDLAKADINKLSLAALSYAWSKAGGQ